MSFVKISQDTIYNGNNYENHIFIENNGNDSNDNNADGKDRDNYNTPVYAVFK